MAFDAGGGGGHCLLVEIETGRATRAFRPWSHPAARGTAGIGSDLDLVTIWTCLVEAGREAMQRAGAAPRSVLGIAATGMRMATIVLDAAGTPLLAVPNRDARAVGEAFGLAEQHGAPIYARTGHWPGPVFTAARLRWLAANNGELLRRANAVLSLSDWIAYRLCGGIATDPSQAGETLLFDLAARGWASDLIELLALPARIFPPVQPAGSRLGGLSPAAAEALGLPAGIAVGVGGGDTQCGLLGVGAVAPGDVAVIAGTTVPVGVVLDRVRLDPGQRLWTGCHVVADRWVLESNAGTMGETLGWLASVFFPDAPQPVARLLAEAGLSEAGASGILSTLGADVMNARDLRLPLGTLTLSHLTTAHDPERRRHVLRAIVEGMACSVRANLEQLTAVAGAAAGHVAFAGGVSRSAVFVQTVSDVLAIPVAVGATGEASALGAAVCAGCAAGVFPDLIEGARRLGAAARTFVPDGPRAQVYREHFATWQRLHAARAESAALAMPLVLPAVLRDMSRAVAPGEPALRPRILATADLDAAGRAALERLGDVEHQSFRRAMRLLAGDALVEALAGVQVFITEVDIVDVAALQRAPTLRVVAACRGDAVNVDVAACTAFGIPVLHAPGRNADAVADLTIAFLLLLARKLPAACGVLRQPAIEAGDMARFGQAFAAFQGRELWQKVVGLIGLGAVGRGVARRLAGFGATILVCDPHLSPEAIALAGAEGVGLDELLERSDFVSLHAAASAETRGLIGARELGRMKRGAFLVNTARAALVDEDALAAALRSGQLAGAALDVFSVEPPGSDHPLLALDGVIATPHVAGNTIEVGAHQARIVADDLGRLLRGETPRHVLNPEVLAAFDWARPRPQPSADLLAGLAVRPARRSPTCSGNRGRRLRQPRRPPRRPPPLRPLPAGKRRRLRSGCGPSCGRSSRASRPTRRCVRRRPGSGSPCISRCPTSAPPSSSGWPATP
jgi:autoinducer 2 (AI-2) kinase